MNIQIKLILLQVNLPQYESIRMEIINKKGILSSFEVNLNITDESKRPKVYNDSKIYME